MQLLGLRGHRKFKSRGSEFGIFAFLTELKGTRPFEAASDLSLRLWKAATECSFPKCPV
jgi:hypothetical protein